MVMRGGDKTGNVDVNQCNDKESDHLSRTNLPACGFTFMKESRMSGWPAMCEVM